VQKKRTMITVEKEKNELALKLLSLNERSVIHSLTLIFDDLTNATKRTSKAQYNKEIDAAVKRVRSGKSVSNEQVMDEMDKW